MFAAAVAVTLPTLVVAVQSVSRKDEAMYAFGRAPATILADLGFGFVRLVWFAALFVLLDEVRFLPSSNGVARVALSIPGHVLFLGFVYVVVGVCVIVFYKWAAAVERESNLEKPN